MDSRESCVYIAKLAEQSERYEDMVQQMKQVVEGNPVLSTEERNLLSVAYKNVIGQKRAAWRILSTIRSKEEEKSGKGEADKKNLCDEYIGEVEKELRATCKDVLEVLSVLIEKVPAEECTANIEATVFYEKMKGDYYRYTAEFLKGEERENGAKKAAEAYEKALKTSEKLATTNPIRLGLALNFSVFYYEIVTDYNKACELAKKAFDDAIADLDKLNSEESYKDSTLIMQLLRDNLTLWKSDIQDEEDGIGDTQVEDIEQDTGS